MKNLIIWLVLAFTLTSCTQSLFNFTIVSTKNLDLDKLSSLEKSSNKAIGEDKASIIIFIPTRTIKIDKAISNTIEDIPGCVALLDGVVYSNFWWIPYIYGEHKFIVEATPLIDPSLAENSQVFPPFGKVHLDKEGKFKSIESITEKEYIKQRSKIVRNGNVTSLSGAQF